MNDRHPTPARRVSRRSFLHTTSAVAVASSQLSGSLLPASELLDKKTQPAILGGTPARSGSWPSWPVTGPEEAAGLQQVLQSGSWFRYRAGNSGKVAEFERQWAAGIGTPYCQATNSGTSALVCGLAALDVGPGDEVIVPPYTFIATINAVLVHHALPVFADTDPETGQIDPGQIEQRITPETRALLPVHLAGAMCDMDRISAIAKSHDLKVIEDACQTLTATWRGKRAGSLGDVGCFSFQNSKNVTCGDGGAMTTNDQLTYARAEAFQNNGGGPAGAPAGRTSNGINLRLTEFQAAVLLGQLSRHQPQAQQRETNGALLDQLLSEIPGVRPKKRYEANERHGYHLYMFDFDPDSFAGMSKDRFLQALRAEGVPASGGYNALNQQPFIEQFLDSRGFKRIYSAQRLKDYREQNRSPANDQMLKTTCWFTQNMLLGTRHDMELIAAAISRIQHHAGAIVKAS